MSLLELDWVDIVEGGSVDEVEVKVVADNDVDD